MMHSPRFSPWCWGRLWDHYLGMNTQSLESMILFDDAKIFVGEILSRLRESDLPVFLNSFVSREKWLWFLKIKSSIADKILSSKQRWTDEFPPGETAFSQCMRAAADGSGDIELSYSGCVPTTRSKASVAEIILQYALQEFGKVDEVTANRLALATHGSVVWYGARGRAALGETSLRRLWTQPIGGCRLERLEARYLGSSPRNGLG